MGAVEIPLSRGKFAYVDEEDAPLIRQYEWYLHRANERMVYARTGDNKPRPVVYMHRFLMGLQKGDRRRVDHINGDTLDNRRSNLRIATARENTLNSYHNRRHLRALSPLQKIELLETSACAVDFAHWVLQGHEPTEFWARFEVLS